MDFKPKGPKEFQDVKTGEMVTQQPIAQKHLTELDAVINDHNNKMNQLVMDSRNFLHLLSQSMDLNRQVITADKKIKEKIINVTKRMKLKKEWNWGYNMNEKCMESRRPPVVTPPPQGEGK